MSLIAENLNSVRGRIEAIARAAGRDPSLITLLAVSKTQSVQAVEEAYAAGQRDFGENYIQELLRKAPALSRLDLRWHYIGRIQTNKAKYLAPLVSLAHTVDSRKTAEELDRRARQAGRVLPILLQVNIAGEEQKNGAAPDEAPDLLDFARGLANLDVRGLMTMPPFWPAERVRPYFRRLCALRDELALARPGLSLPELSMGMSADFEAAIEEGSTLVRIGSAIFGERT